MPRIAVAFVVILLVNPDLAFSQASKLNRAVRLTENLEPAIPHPEQEELRKVFISRWAENDKSAYLEAMKGIMGWSVKDRLGEIRCPTLIIGADGDYFSIEDKRAYTSMIPAAELVIVENSMHALPAEKPEEFNSIVLGFLLGSS